MARKYQVEKDQSFQVKYFQPLHKPQKELKMSWNSLDVQDGTNPTTTRGNIDFLKRVTLYIDI